MRKSHRWGVTIAALLCATLGPVCVTRAQQAELAPAAAPESDPVDPVFKIERIEPPTSSAPPPAPSATTPTAQASERPPIFAPAHSADSLPDQVPLPRSFRPALSISYALGPLLGI